jgi:hypothetical protein
MTPVRAHDAAALNSTFPIKIETPVAALKPYITASAEKTNAVAIEKKDCLTRTIKIILVANTT